MESGAGPSWKSVVSGAPTAPCTSRTSRSSQLLFASRRRRRAAPRRRGGGRASRASGGEDLAVTVWAAATGTDVTRWSARVTHDEPQGIPSSLPGEVVPARARARGSEPRRSPAPPTVRGGVPGCPARRAAFAASRTRLFGGMKRETFRDSPLAMRRSRARRPCGARAAPDRRHVFKHRPAGGFAYGASGVRVVRRWRRRSRDRERGGALRGDAGDPQNETGRCRCRAVRRGRARRARSPSRSLRAARSRRRIAREHKARGAAARDQGELGAGAAALLMTGRARRTAAGARDPNGDVGDDVDTSRSPPSGSTRAVRVTTRARSATPGWLASCVRVRTPERRTTWPFAARPRGRGGLSKTGHARHDERRR